MNFPRMGKMVMPVIALWVLLYFVITGVVIADTSESDIALYFMQISLVLVLAGLMLAFYKGVSYTALYSKRVRAVLSQSPMMYAIYQTDTGEFEVSDSMEVEFSSIAYDDFLLMITEHGDINVSMLKSFINEKDISKSLGFTINIGKKCYKCTCKWRFESVIFWLYDNTADIANQIELLSWVNEYRERHYNLVQSCNLLDIPIWINAADGSITFKNRAFILMNQKYNQEAFLDAEFVRVGRLEKKFLDESGVELFTFISFKSHYVGGYVGYCLRESELYRAERKNKALENVVSRLSEHSVIATLLLDQDLRVVLYNRAFIQLFELADRAIPNGVHYKYLFDILKDKQKLPEIKGFREKHLGELKNCPGYVTDIWHLQSGHTIKVDIIANYDGGVIITYQNITHNVEMETEMHKARLMFMAVVQMIDYPMLILSHTGKINFMNDSFVSICMKEKQYIPTDIAELRDEAVVNIQHVDMNSIITMIGSTISGKKVSPYQLKILEVEYIAESKMLEDFSVVLTIQPFLLYNQKVYGQNKINGE